jgi:hypothetical protein
MTSKSGSTCSKEGTPQMRSMRLPKPLQLGTLLCLCALMGCATTGRGTPTSGTSNPLCLADSALSFSKDDTAATKEEVRRHNAAWRAVCKP